jgi:hypothetical protein
MLNIAEELKTIYKNDVFPLCEEMAAKDLRITFPEMDPIYADQMVEDKFELTEGICFDDQFKFGACNAAKVKLTMADAPENIKGKEFDLVQYILSGETTYSVPLGIYKVDSATKQDDLKFKEIIAYDRMTKIDVDVASWYNGLFPNGDETYTLAAFRASFLAYIGLEEDTSNLPMRNDSMTITKTIDPSQLSGRSVIEACEELNGCFGLIGHDGKFTHIVLKPMHHDYPQDDYPGSDYPVIEPYDEYLDNYEGIHFEEYQVQPIDKIQIRQEENDVGAIYGTGTNVYIIQGNFLVYGKSAEELQTIAQNAATNIFDRGYRPYTANGIGLPYIQPGDFIKYNGDDTTAGYVFERTLTGIQILRDEYAARGSAERVQEFGVNNEIIQLQGKTAILKKTVEEVSASVTDLDLQLTGEINVLAGQVILKVDSNGNIGYVELTGDPDTDMTHLVLKANNISLNGYVGINNGVIITEDGKLHAVDGEFSGDITASSFIGGYLQSLNYSPGVSGMKIDLETGTIYVESGATFTSQGAEYNTSIHDGYIDTEYIQMMAFNVRNGRVTADATGFYADVAHIDELNGGMPITTTNISQYTPSSSSIGIGDVNGLSTILNDILYRLTVLENNA